MEVVKSHYCYAGTLRYYEHQSVQTNTPMRFTVFTPPKVTRANICLVFLSGLTCTEDNFTTKAGAYKKAAELGIYILAPDTSPRGEDVADDDSYDLGQGAGFYIDAKQNPWAKHFRMESYIIQELVPLAQRTFDIKPDGFGVCGHSMGGHGALTFFLKYPDLFQTCSAFSPIVAPSQVLWGQKAFTAYLGDDHQEWTKHDATALIELAPNDKHILIDQGLDDEFLQDQLKPELFEKACKAVGQKLELRFHEGYDHSYFFIQSFMDSHLEWHANYLTSKKETLT